MKAIILAAGEGKRLAPFTADRPKCMVELGGKPLLSYQLDTLKKMGVREIHLVTGYRADAFAQLGLPTIHNPHYNETNMVETLLKARALLDGREDVLIAYSDIIYEEKALRPLFADLPALVLSINSEWLKLWKRRMADPLMDAETLVMTPQGRIIEIGKKAKSYDRIQGQYMGLIKVPTALQKTILDVYDRMDRNRIYDGQPFRKMFMTSFLQHMIDSGIPVIAANVAGGWLEIDSTEDLRFYEQMIKTGEIADYCNVFK